MDTSLQPRDDAEIEDVLAGSRALVGISARSLADALEEISLQQYRVLVLLWSRGPLRSGAVAEAIGVHPSTFTRAVDRLAAGGWVERLENPETRREVLIAATDPGRELVEQVMGRRRREIVAVLSQMSPERRTAAAQGLRAFAEAAGEVDPHELARLGHET